MLTKNEHKSFSGFWYLWILNLINETNKLGYVNTRIKITKYEKKIFYFKI